jgi:hypothetical protein
MFFFLQMGWTEKERATALKKREEEKDKIWELLGTPWFLDTPT